jgi:hypothetical protein
LIISITKGVDSQLSKWYAGSALFCHAQNNACEGTNRWVKETHTKRSLQSISRFLKLLFDMVRSSIAFKIKCLNLLTQSKFLITIGGWPMRFCSVKRRVIQSKLMEVMFTS